MNPSIGDKSGSHTEIGFELGLFSLTRNGIDIRVYNCYSYIYVQSGVLLIGFVLHNLQFRASCLELPASRGRHLALFFQTCPAKTH